MPYKNLDLRKQKSSERYHNQKEKGLCVLCSLEPVENNTSICKICTNIRETKRQERINKGLCSRCGNVATHGKMCEACRNLTRKGNNSKYTKRKLAKLCVKCGNPLNGKSIIYCECCRLLSIKQHLLSRYKLSEEEYDNKINSQNGLCLICKDPPKNFLCIDHDHITGKVRGLICENCNKMLGFSKDNPNTLKNGAAYLISFGG